MHGEMGYLSREDRLARRWDPRIVLEGAQSLIVSSVFYWPGRSGFPATSTPARGLSKDLKHFAFGRFWMQAISALPSHEYSPTRL